MLTSLASHRELNGSHLRQSRVRATCIHKMRQQNVRFPSLKHKVFRAQIVCLVKLKLPIAIYTRFKNRRLLSGSLVMRGQSLTNLLFPVVNQLLCNYLPTYLRPSLLAGLLSLSILTCCAPFCPSCSFFVLLAPF